MEFKFTVVNDIIITNTYLIEADVYINGKQVLQDCHMYEPCLFWLNSEGPQNQGHTILLGHSGHSRYSRVAKKTCAMEIDNEIQYNIVREETIGATGTVSLMGPQHGWPPQRSWAPSLQRHCDVEPSRATLLSFEAAFDQLWTWPLEISWDPPDLSLSLFKAKLVSRT